MSLEEMFETNGFYVEEIDGELRYMTRDERGRAVFGPRQRRTHGWMAKLHGRTRRNNRPQPSQKDAEATILLSTGEEVGVGVKPAQIRDAAEGKWSRRLKDGQWHRAVQHTAVDVAMWASCLALSAVALKAAWFVVAL